jgi:AmiR/NasT family two-component response regulator
MDASQSQRRVLVVDDERDLAALLAEELRRAGHDVSVAESAEEAIAAVISTKPDLAVLDIRMRSQSGLQLAALLREQFHVPFVFLTALEDERTVREATAAGALAYLVKGDDLRHCLPTIDAAMARAKELSDLRQTESQLSVALQQSRSISVATGLLMERLKIAQDTAFAVLRDEARNRRQRMSETAEELLQAAERLNSVTATSRTRR